MSAFASEAGPAAHCCCAAARSADPTLFPLLPTPLTERLAQYSAALRCEWPLVAQWKCDDCFPEGTELLDSYVISEANYDTASDAYTVSALH